MQQQKDTRRALYALVETLYTLIDDMQDTALALGDLITTIPEVKDGQNEQA